MVVMCSHLLGSARLSPTIVAGPQEGSCGSRRLLPTTGYVRRSAYSGRHFARLGFVARASGPGNEDMTHVRRSIRTRLAGLATLGLLAASLPGPAQAHAPSPSMRVRGPYKISDGITLRTVAYPTPNQVRILAIRPQGTSATVEQDVSGPEFGNYRLVSGMGDSNGAVAA